MNSRLVPPFRTLFAALPADVKEQARRAFALFRDDPHHPGLHFKKVTARHAVWSVRIGRSYRALGVRDGEDILWYWIGNHADYDEQLKRFR